MKIKAKWGVFFQLFKQQNNEINGNNCVESGGNGNFPLWRIVYWATLASIRGLGTGSTQTHDGSQSSLPSLGEKEEIWACGASQRRGGRVWGKGRWWGAKTLQALGQRRGQPMGAQSSAQVPPECNPNASFQLLSSTCHVPPTFQPPRTTRSPCQAPPPWLPSSSAFPLQRTILPATTLVKIL